MAATYQIVQLLQVLSNDNQQYFDSFSIASKLGIDQEDIFEMVTIINQLSEIPIRLESRQSGYGKYNLSIDRNKKERLRNLMALPDGKGWDELSKTKRAELQKNRSEQEANLTFQRRKEEAELRATELNIEDFPTMKRNRFWTLLLAFAAFVISIIALLK